MDLKPTLSTVLQLSQIYKSSKIRVPQWNVVLEGAIAAQRLVARTLQESEVFQLLS